MNDAKHIVETLLTEREIEILSLIAAGMGSKAIANHLNISINTVASHRKNMLGKTGAKSSTELVHIYITFTAAINNN